MLSAIECVLPQTLRTKVKHLIIPLFDGPNQPITQCFDQVYEFIEENRKTTNVVVHCAAGVSRSVALAISYIMRKYGYDFDTALLMVRNRRKVASPNYGFQKQLRSYYDQLHSKPKDKPEKPVESDHVDKPT